MPAIDGEWVPYTQQEIYENLEAALEAEFDTSVELGDLVKKQLEAEAKTLAENQEQSLQRVYQSAYLDTAEDEELERLVELIGLERREANGATGIVEFSRETVPSSTYTIQSGLTVQTEGSDPLEYNTTTLNKLHLIGDFETGDLTNWEDDVTSFNVVSTGALIGDYSVEVPATSGVQITRSTQTYSVGTTFNATIEPDAGTITGFKFGVQDSSNYYEAVINESTSEITLRLVEAGAEVTAPSTSVTIPTSERSFVEIRWNLNSDPELLLYDSKDRDSILASVDLTETREWSEGDFAITSKDATATALVDGIGTTRTTSNIEAAGDGVETNVGPDTILVIADDAPGVEDVTNPVATGDISYLDNTYSPLVTGLEEEEDEELRERAFENTSIGGAATVTAISTELERVEGVQSLTIYRNRDDSTSADGLPPHSFEAVVHGGQNEEIAQAIFETASIDSTDYGGAHGTETTYDVQSDVTNDTDVIHWSRPVEVTVDITVDLIVDDTYIGDEEVQSIIVGYVGGTNVDGSEEAGLGVGEDIYEAVLNGKLVDPTDKGVWEVDSITIDSDSDGTDDTTTTASGADVFAVADNEVVTTDARDGSVTVNTTLK